MNSNSKKSSWKSKLAMTIGGLIAIILAVFLTWGTRINCWQWDIDLNSGQLRASRLIFWISTKQQFEDTSLSDALKTVGALPENHDWRTMLLDPPDFVPSQQNSLNGVLSQIGDVKGVWKSAEFSPEAQKSVALWILQNWKRQTWGANGNRTVVKYIKALGVLAESSAKQHQKIGENEVKRLNDSISN